MKAPTLLAVEAAPEAFTELLELGRRQGIRIGWLDWRQEPIDWPGSLREPLAAGAERAGIVAPGGAVVGRRRAGPAHLRDVVRSHFLGCHLVLVRGLAGVPRLEALDSGFRLEGARLVRSFADAGKLLEELRRPRWRSGR